MEQRAGAVEGVVNAFHVSPAFWPGKRVLITGHTGFKGGWLTVWLRRLGARISGISLPPVTTPSLFHLARIEALCDSHFADIRDAEGLARLCRDSQPEVVFHLAAQPLVRASYRQPLETFAINVMGTAHLLEALRGLDSVRSVVIVTTDKVYRNNEWCWPYREEDTLGGHDPYSASKAACELVVDSYRRSFLAEQGVAVASARAGNVIGGGDWSEDRLIPDAIRAWQSRLPLRIRRPEAIRPWQHVLEPVAGYLCLAERIWHNPALAGAYNFGPEPHTAATVREVIALAKDAYGAGDVIFETDAQGPHEAGWLALDIARARVTLGVTPRWGLAETVKRTLAWYRAQQQGTDARDLCLAEIADFVGREWEKY